MSENASHVVVHHHFGNGSGANVLSMTCCIVLSVVVVLILLIIFAIATYLIFQISKRNRQSAAPTNLPLSYVNMPQTSTGASRVTSNAFNSNIRKGISNPAASFEDNEMDMNSNSQNVPPMSTSQPDVDVMQANTSASSAGLCELLFPQQHEGEVIYETLPKIAFTERVYSSSRGNALPPSEPGVSHRNSNCVNTSMEWDYHESRRYETSHDSETDRKNTVDVCWV